MRYGIVAALLFVVATVTPAHAATYYQATLTSIGNDLYRDEWSRAVIRTTLCVEYVFYEDAVLAWEGRRLLGNKLIFKSGATCEVIGVSGSTLP